MHDHRSVVTVYQINSKLYYHRGTIDKSFHLLLGSFGDCLVRSGSEPSLPMSSWFLKACSLAFRSASCFSFLAWVAFQSAKCALDASSWAFNFLLLSGLCAPPCNWLSGSAMILVPIFSPPILEGNRGNWPKVGLRRSKWYLLVAGRNRMHKRLTSPGEHR